MWDRFRASVEYEAQAEYAYCVSALRLARLRHQVNPRQAQERHSAFYDDVR